VATAVLDPKKDDVVQIIRSQTEEGVGVDSAIECVGNESALNTCVEAVRNRGTVAQVGLHVRRASVDPALWAMKDITIEATWCYPVTIWPRVIALIESGKLPVERIITGRIKADDVVEKGFRTLLDPSGNQMKVLVTV
jgi:(R,R)-butanediol dehydrogenase/meso-butanediol dehydrogenase/diacetyl reductase